MRDADVIDRGDRRAVERVLLLAIVLALLASLGCATPDAPRPTAVAVAPVAARAGSAGVGAVTAVDAIGMTVADLDRSLAFYTSVLGFERERDVRLEHDPCRPAGARRARLRLGDEVVELTQYRRRGRAVPADSHSLDGWFQHVAIIVSDIDAAYARLRAHRVRSTTVGAPQRLPESNPPAAGIAAYYFQDPDGHPLEILQFPADKGAPKWHRASDALFLGIDHTAIVVRDSERSLRFYRDILGMHVTGGSVNRGIEQERLSGVPGAQVRITSLRADAGPGIELLEYLAPPGGRPLPADARAADLFHWETTLVAAHAASDSHRDPDGHVVRIIEENDPCR